jgi:ABC-type polysaccharide/polyol phosphate export permease
MRRKKYFNLLHQLALAQFKLKDQSAILGFLWSFLHPLILLGILFAMFRSQTGQGIDHYALYLLIGLVQYTHFANSTSRALTVLYSMKHLTANAIFPKEVLVLSATMADTIELALSMAICVVVAGFSGITVSWTVLLLPVVCLLQYILVSSVSLVLSCLYVFVRDIAHIYGSFLRVLIFITPIFYAGSFLGEGLGRYILLLNPLAYLINFSRTLIIDGKPVAFQSALVLLLVTSLLLFFSFRLFKNYEPVFSEHL